MHQKYWWRFSGVRDWLGPRPDLMKGISDITRRITTWSKADDRRLFRLMSYLKGTARYVLESRTFDEAKALRLCLYTDADHASGVEDVKSTTGMILTLEGPNSFWPWCWGSRCQGATAHARLRWLVLILGFSVKDCPCKSCSRLSWIGRLLWSVNKTMHQLSKSCMAVIVRNFDTWRKFTSLICHLCMKYSKTQMRSGSMLRQLYRVQIHSQKPWSHASGQMLSN